MDNYEIMLTENDTKGVFTMYMPHVDHDIPVKSGEMTFSKAGATTWIIDHTEVPEAMKGNGAAAALVKRGVEVARERGLTVIPLCPFAKVQFQRHPEYQDVLRR